MAVFSGNAHPELAHAIARCLHVPLAKAQVGRFSDGEMNVEILENIRGRDAFIIQPTCPPTSENLMELLIMVDAASRASAARITAVIPYFGFARQDHNQLKRLEQRDWGVDFDRYREAGGQQMPARLNAASSETTVRLVIDKWVFLKLLSEP